MRVSNERYSRDLRSIDLAHRMLQHEARTQTVCDWTGLKGDRVRNLARNYHWDADRMAMQRRRGPPPTQLSGLMRHRRMRSEVAAAAGLCRVLQVLPEEPTPRARRALPGLIRGERLLDAFELFRAAIPHTQLTLEQLILVVVTLAEGGTWAIDHCAQCHATILIDQLSKAPRRSCAQCGPTEGSGGKDLVDECGPSTSDPEAGGGALQQPLFD